MGLFYSVFKRKPKESIIASSQKKIVFYLIAVFDPISGPNICVGEQHTNRYRVLPHKSTV